jgi:succinyldiaminopimelate transaminase
LVAWLPTFSVSARVILSAFPAVAYPTYDVGARLAGATPVPVTSLTALGPLTSATRPKLLWLNSPGNPDGKVLGVGHLRKVVAWARASMASSWPATSAMRSWTGAPTGLRTTRRPRPPCSTPRVTDGDVRGLLAAYSMSKQSNLAGYRAAFLAGDPALIAQIAEVRKHAGMMMPTPVQHALVAALGDETHVAAQVATYRARREILLPAVEAFGLRIDGSEAGLYLWVTADEDCWTTLGRLADRGILAAAGSFYGAASTRHVRIALTATDEQIAGAAARLRG